MKRFALGLVLIGLATGCQENVALYSDLSEQQANEVHAALRGQGIAAEKINAEDQAWAIHVPAERSPEAMKILDSQGLPSRKFAAMDELFSGEGFVSSPQEDRARYIYGLSQSLERTLAGLDAVVNARVHLALPEDKKLSDDDKSGSAAVVVVHEPRAEIRERETNIRAIVTDGIEEISDPNQVTVEFFEKQPHEPVAQEIDDDEPGGEIDRQTMIAGVSAAGGLIFLGVGIAGFVYWRRQDAAAQKSD